MSTIWAKSPRVGAFAVVRRWTQARTVIVIAVIALVVVSLCLDAATIRAAKSETDFIDRASMLVGIALLDVATVFSTVIMRQSAIMM